MRDCFVETMREHVRDRDVVFLTGDLGFMALEPLRDEMSDRFINCGVAEQNMIGVAAGLAHSGHEVWVYSIAPFCYARPFEQIRNDIVLNNLPVCLVGNGGGYAYGVMGPTHHALEDYGVLLTLRGMNVFVPAVDTDLAPMISTISSLKGPSYLRLGRSELTDLDQTEPYSPWRCLSDGGDVVIVACGPIAGAAWEAAAQLELAKISFWICSELPIAGDRIPPPMLDKISAAAELLVVEEHTAHGGAGMNLVHQLALLGTAPRSFRHLCAQGYPSGRYGSQQFHRIESGIDAATIKSTIEDCLA